MYRLWISTYKEFLLLKRDFGGLVILFIMPLVLLIAVTLIQDSSFGGSTNVKIPILLIDNDKGDVSNSIITNLQKSNAFKIITNLEGVEFNEERANEEVLKGNYQMAVVIPANLTANLNTKVSQNVAEILAELGVDDNPTINTETIHSQLIKIYFDPVVNMSFKNGIKNEIDKMVSKLETEAIYTAFQKELEIENNVYNSNKLFTFLEINPNKDNVLIKPNSVQHNVPAWALFAIFFIIIPLSINIVAEKNQGTFVRLKTSPISFKTTLFGKIAVYLTVCMLQFVLMLLIGFYLFPLIGLPEFTINGSYFLLFIMALFSGLAAIGFGILLGTLAQTPEQSAPFGATAVVILAAIGGVWIPVFAMPQMMQVLAKLSPMNWGLSGFYDVIIRNGDFIDILPEISMLGFFFYLMILISIYYEKSKNAV